MGRPWALTVQQMIERIRHLSHEIDEQLRQNEIGSLKQIIGEKNCWRHWDSIHQPSNPTIEVSGDFPSLR